MSSLAIALTIGLGIAAIFAAVGCWVAWQIMRQNGRILVRIEAIEERLASQSVPSAARSVSTGLSTGSIAPSFELDDLSGQRQRLADYLGRPVLLVFFDPACGFCEQMAPDLAALPFDAHGDGLVPLIVTSGDRDANVRIVAENGIRAPVLLQRAREVAETYQAYGTPIGYRVGADGRIASAMAVGADALLALAAPPGLVSIREPQPNGNGAAAHSKGHAPSKGDPSLERSRLTRDGLKAGTVAPAFRLPRLDGGEIALDDYRGRRVLLVFSDPGCGPCMDLAPELERAQHEPHGPDIVLISRGDLEANRAKVRALGLTLPVAMQKQWEISRAYGMFATPIGYLVDADGVIAADVAIGKDPILELMKSAARLVPRAPRKVQQAG